MGQSRIDGDLFVNGRISSTGLTAPASSITNSNIAAAAGIDSSKLDHRFRKHYNQNSTASSATVAIHIANAAGSVNGIKAGSVAACSGAATITINLLKNGASILTGVIQLDNGNTARVSESGAFASTTYASGDFFELVIVATAGGGTLGTGLLVDVEFDEEAA